MTPSTCVATVAPTMDYSVPRRSSFKLLYMENIPREALLTETLKLPKERSSKPLYLDSPIKKSFPETDQSKVTIDPLHDILSTSKRMIEQYIVQLPFANESKSISSSTRPKTPRKTMSNNLIETPSRGQKRTRPSEKEQDLRNTSNAMAFESPIPNKTIFFSPHHQGSTKQVSRKSSQLFQSTPAFKDFGILKKQSPLKLLKSDLASTLEFSQLVIPSSEPLASTPMKEYAPFSYTPMDKNDNQEEENYDELACHADNILRMAVDSTMLGSSYNASLSSNYSVGPNDSMNGILSRKKNMEVFDDNDPERSLLEIKKAKWGQLSREKATKIEINAEDLQNILGD